MSIDRVTRWRGFRAYMTRPHDGDSFWVMADGGFDGRAEPELRLADVHAPELLMRLPPRGQPGGTETTDFVNDWMQRAQAGQPGRRWYLSVATALTSRAEPEQRTTFRRYVAHVWRYDDWPEPWATEQPWSAASLNSAIHLFLSTHPDWPPGE